VFHFCPHREFNRVVRTGMPPAEAAGIFGGIVFCVADHYIRAAHELDWRSDLRGSGRFPETSLETPWLMCRRQNIL